MPKEFPHDEDRHQEFLGRLQAREARDEARREAEAQKLKSEFKAPSTKLKYTPLEKQVVAIKVLTLFRCGLSSHA